MEGLLDVYWQGTKLHLITLCPSTRQRDIVVAAGTPPLGRKTRGVQNPCPVERFGLYDYGRFEFLKNIRQHPPFSVL